MQKLLSILGRYGGFEGDYVFPTHDEEAVMNGAPEPVAAAKRRPLLPPLTFKTSTFCILF